MRSEPSLPLLRSDRAFPAKAAELGKYGVDKVHVLDDPALEHYLAETYVPVIAQIVEKNQPVAVILPASVDGRDIGSRLGATNQLAAAPGRDRDSGRRGRKDNGQMAALFRQMLCLVRLGPRRCTHALNSSEHHEMLRCG